MAIYDNYRLRFNTVLNALEMNVGGEDWELVPQSSIVPSEIALTNGQILVGNGSNLSASVTQSGDLTMTNTGVVTLSNAAVIGKVLTGYSSGAGTIASTDTLLQAFNKLNGNVALSFPTAGGTIHGNLIVDPVTNSTATFQVNQQDGTTHVLTVDTSNQFVTVGTPQTDADFGVRKSSVTPGSETIMQVKEGSSTSAAGLQCYNDANNGLHTLVCGTAHATVELRSKPILLSPNEGIRLASEGTDQAIDFAFGGILQANVRALIGSDGSYSMLNDSGSAIAIASNDGSINYAFLGADSTNGLTMNIGASPATWTFHPDGSISPPNILTDPISPTEGTTWYNATSHTWRGYNGTSVGTFTFVAD